MTRKKEKPNCKKIKYFSAKAAGEAKKTINGQKSERGESRLLRSIYQCPKCKHWHTSSMTRNHAQRIIESNAKRIELVNPGMDVVNSRLQFLQRKKK